jgi:hypothetical protein
MHASLLAFCVLVGFSLQCGYCATIDPAIGIQSVLVVEVNAGTFGNSKTKQDITRSVFGNGEGIDLTSVYKTCSHNKLNLVRTTNRNAASPSGDGIIDGAFA